MEDQVSDDRLNDLPLSLIHDILERVPIRDAIRTSVLSKQWRYTWTTLPTLLFKGNSDECDYLDDKEYEEFHQNTKKFINNVLLSHKGPIYRFEVSYPWYNFSLGNVEEWVLCLSRNDIRELIVDRSSNETDLLNSSIYSCTKLTKLELRDFKLDPVPSTFKGFLFLKSLVLDGVELSPCGVESIVAFCPILETLKLKVGLFLMYKGYRPTSVLRIHSPKLKVLQVSGDYMEVRLYAPLLNYMDVDLIAGLYFKHEIQRSVCNYTNFLGGIIDLVELTGRTFFTRYLSIGIESCYSKLVLHHLKVIDLHVSFIDIKEITVIGRLILDSPNLHKLDIKAFLGQTPTLDGAPDVCYREYFGVAPSFKLEKLKYIIMDRACRYPSGMQLVKFLLETSTALEKMELLVAKRVNEVANEVLGFDKASPNAMVTINNHIC